MNRATTITKTLKPLTSGQSFFLPAMFKQTLLQIRGAQTYFETQGKTELPMLPQQAQLLYATEMSRVTMRLSCVMAWCLGQQALVRGEINPHEALEHFRLEGADICLEAPSGSVRLLPPQMQEILTETHQLYERAWRLDEQLSRQLMH